MTQNQTLTHLDANGDIAMVDVSTKTATTRTATATGQVIFPADIYTAIKNAQSPKPPTSQVSWEQKAPQT